ncbi:MAG: hypothetical protein IPM42_09950 [Saprospiraceae bacterium]|nr:hypothetical protein [Saprospiraceae bacterium]
MYLNTYIFILTIIITFSGCFSDLEESTETIIKHDLKTVIASANVVINVTDENGKPLTGLTARFNKQTKIINQASYFQFEAKDILKENELLTITDNDGQIYEYALYNIENQVNYHKLTLFRKSERVIFSASAGGIISYPSGKLNIDLTSSEFTAGSETYAGSITCFYNEFDLNNPYHEQAISGGNLINVNGKKSYIDWLHVFRFDLLTQTEMSLSLVKPITVQLNLSTNGTSHIIQYDRVQKKWVYHGIFVDKLLSLKTSGIYAVVQLYEPTVIKGTFQTNNLSMVRQPVNYSFDGKIKSTLTTNDGKWEVIVPRNREISIISDSDCINQNTRININSTSEIVSIGTINFTIPEFKEITLKGSFRDCNAEELSSGFIILENGGKTEYYFIPNSNFELKIPVCVHGALLFGAAGFNSEEISKISFPNEKIEMGNIYLCPGFENHYITLRTTDGNKVYTENVSVVDFNGIYQIQFKSNSQEFLFKFKNNEQTGQIQNSEGNIVWRDSGFLNKGIEVNCPTSSTCGFEDIIILSYMKNGWVKGSFKGTFWAKTLMPLSAKNLFLQGDFFVKL